MARALRIGWVFAATGALALGAACSLNPQPIPPGETNGTSDGGAFPPGAGGGADGSKDGEGGSTTGPRDASIGDQPDAGPTPSDDAGDASDDASDAGDAGDQ